MPPLAALLLDWVVTALWPIVGSLGTRYYSGLIFSQGGLAVGLVLMLPWLLRGGRWRKLFDPALAPNLFLMGLLSGLATVVYISALAYTTPANAAIMAQVEVIYSALLCAYFLGERLGAQQSAASLLVMAGTGLIMARDLSSPRWRGDLLILATPWLYQVSHIFSKRLPRNLDPVVIAAGRAFYGFVVMIPILLWALFSGQRYSFQPQALGILLLQGALLSSANFVLWYMAILRMDLAKATAIMLSYPALTVLFSWLLGREAIQVVQLTGLVITLAGASWVSRLVLLAQQQLPSERRLPPEAPAEF